MAAFLWAIDAPFRKYLTGGLSSTTIVFMEHALIGALVLAALWPHLKECKKLGWKEWLAVAFVGFGGSALATVLFTQSFHYVNPSVAILLQKVQPLIAIGLAVVILREKLTRKFWFWAIAAIAGAYLISFPELAPQGLSLAGGTLGVLLALGAAFLWAGSTVFGRLLLKKASFQAVTAMRFLSALVFLSVLTGTTGKLSEVTSASPKEWIYAAITAVVAGFISLFIYYRGLKFTPASTATLAELTFPFAAVVINWVFLGAALFPVQLIGGVLLLYSITKLSLANSSVAFEQTA